MVNVPLPLENDAEVVSVYPGVRLSVSRDESRLRLDSLDAPEFYAEIDLSSLSETHSVVPGRFSDQWFRGGSIARPRCRWLVKDVELEVSSPGDEFVAILRL